MSKNQLATRIDHFYVISQQAESLFTYFRDMFQLPEVWPFAQYEGWANGGLSLGNVAFEFIIFVDKESTSLATSFKGIAFEPREDADATVTKLTQRNIAHSGVARAEIQIAGIDLDLVVWENVDMMDFPPTEARVFFCDFKQREQITQIHKSASDELVSRNGGPLGIIGLSEFVMGVKDLSEAQTAWKSLLGSSEQVSNDIIHFDTGPRIRLVSTGSPGIQSITLKIGSISEAEHFLKQHALFSLTDSGRIAIKPAAIDGLVIELEEE